MEQEVIQEKPIIMHPIPRFNELVVGQTFSQKYIMTSLTQKEIDNIYAEYAAMQAYEAETKKVSEGFTIRIGKRVIGDGQIYMFGEADEWSSIIERKLSDITTNNPLVVRVPIDKAKNLIGNRLNTGALLKMIHEYNVAVIGSPKYLIIFKDGKFSKTK